MKESHYEDQLQQEEEDILCPIELKRSRYSRTDLAGVTQQINRLFPMPAIVFISYDSKLSIAVINRRHNKVNRDRDVLEKVSLIWEIDTKKPYRAHLDILESLFLAEFGALDRFKQQAAKL